MFFLFLPLLILFLYDRIGDILINLLNLFLNITHIEIDLWGTYSAFLDAFLATMLSILCYIFYRKVFPKKKAEISIPIWQGILFAIVIGLGVGGLSGIWLSIVDFLASHSSSLGNQLESFSGMYDDLESGPYIWTFLAIVAIGPLVEEILFRGIIFRSFEEASDCSSLFRTYVRYMARQFYSGCLHCNDGHYFRLFYEKMPFSPLCCSGPCGEQHRRNLPPGSGYGL